MFVAELSLAVVVLKDPHEQHQARALLSGAAGCDRVERGLERGELEEPCARERPPARAQIRGRDQREAAVVVDFSRGAGTRIDKTDDEARRSQRRRRIVCIICT